MAPSRCLALRPPATLLVGVGLLMLCPEAHAEYQLTKKEIDRAFNKAKSAGSLRSERAKLRARLRNNRADFNARRKSIFPTTKRAGDQVDAHESREQADEIFAAQTAVTKAAEILYSEARADESRAPPSQRQAAKRLTTEAYLHLVQVNIARARSALAASQVVSILGAIEKIEELDRTVTSSNRRIGRSLDYREGRLQTLERALQSTFVTLAAQTCKTERQAFDADPCYSNAGAQLSIFAREGDRLPRELTEEIRPLYSACVLRRIGMALTSSWVAMGQLRSIDLRLMGAKDVPATEIDAAIEKVTLCADRLHILVANMSAQRRPWEKDYHDHHDPAQISMLDGQIVKANECYAETWRALARFGDSHPDHADNQYILQARQALKGLQLLNP